MWGKQNHDNRRQKIHWESLENICCIACAINDAQKSRRRMTMTETNKIQISLPLTVFISRLHQKVTVSTTAKSKRQNPLEIELKGRDSQGNNRQRGREGANGDQAEREANWGNNKDEEERRGKETAWDAVFPQCGGMIRLGRSVMTISHITANKLMPVLLYMMHLNVSLTFLAWLLHRNDVKQPIHSTGKFQTNQLKSKTLSKLDPPAGVVTTVLTLSHREEALYFDFGCRGIKSCGIFFSRNQQKNINNIKNLEAPGCLLPQIMQGCVLAHMWVCALKPACAGVFVPSKGWPQLCGSQTAVFVLFKKHPRAETFHKIV